MKRTIKVFVFAVLTSTAVNCYADDKEDSEGLFIPETKVSLVQAITIAEQSASGRAFSADLETHDGQWIFDVEIIDGLKTMDVRVDPESGQILAAVDTDDNDDDEEETEDQDEKHD